MILGNWRKAGRACSDLRSCVAISRHLEGSVLNANQVDYPKYLGHFFHTGSVRLLTLPSVTNLEKKTIYVFAIKKVVDLIHFFHTCK